MSMGNFNIYYNGDVSVNTKVQKDFFKRYMDDTFVIWRKQGECVNKYQDFKNTLNAISNLDWEYEELNETVTS